MLDHLNVRTSTLPRAPLATSFLQPVDLGEGAVVAQHRTAIAGVANRTRPPTWSCARRKAKRAIRCRSVAT